MDRGFYVYSFALMFLCFAAGLFSGLFARITTDTGSTRDADAAERATPSTGSTSAARRAGSAASGSPAAGSTNTKGHVMRPSEMFARDFYVRADHSYNSVAIYKWLRNMEEK